MKNKVDLLNRARIAYYKGEPIMSDSEYDKLYDELEKAEKETGLIYANSPAQTVGASPVDYIDKIKHEHPMLSLSKVHVADDIVKFGNKDIVAMYKADGLTISATYIDGDLTRLETRGDGTIGNDVLFHAKSFKNLPLHINKKGKYVIDGEAIIKWDDFDKISQASDVKHPRNLAAGTLNQLDPKVSASRYLKFYAWDVIEGGSYTLLDKNLNDAMELGFDVVAYYLITPDDLRTYELSNFLNFMRQLAKEESFPIDGLVFKYNNIPYGRSLGMTGHHPRNAIAYKYEDDRYETKVIGVDWTLGKTGVIVPTLVTEPVEIDKISVNRASLHNISIYKQLKPSKGATAYLYRANGVIPNCDTIEDDGYEEIPIPKICPLCGGNVALVKSDNSEVLMCASPNCKGKRIAKLNAFVNKKGLDIRGFSEQTITKLYDLGLIKNYVDIFNLRNYYNKLINLDGFGKVSVDKLLESIENSRKVQLNKLITALSIPGIGEVQAKIISNVVTGWEDFIAKAQSKYDFTNIDGIGDILNANIHEWGNYTYVNDDIEELISYLDIVSNSTDNINDKLSGLTFVITGNIESFKNRNEMIEFIERYGGKVSGSVSNKTNYLINNDITSDSSKNKKAKQLGIQIITEKDLLGMVE